MNLLMSLSPPFGQRCFLQNFVLTYLVWYLLHLIDIHHHHQIIYSLNLLIACLIVIMTDLILMMFLILRD